MFVNIRLFTKRDNKITDPHPSWLKRSTIYCTGELNLGLGQKYAWTVFNPLPLHKVIEFYNLLAATEPGSTQYKYSFDNTISISWEMEKRNQLNLAVYSGWRKAEDGLRILASNINLQEVRRDFYLSVMNVLIRHTNNDVCTKVGAQFYKDPANMLEFTMGQKVKTVLSTQVKTERTGYVIQRFYHDKEKTNKYYLLVKGQILYRPYSPGDLEKI